MIVATSDNFCMSSQARSTSHSFSPLFNSSSCRMLNCMCFTKFLKQEAILNSNFRTCSVLIERCRATVLCVQKIPELCHPICLVTEIEKCLRLTLQGSGLGSVGSTPDDCKITTR